MLNCLYLTPVTPDWFKDSNEFVQVGKTHLGYRRPWIPDAMRCRKPLLRSDPRLCRTKLPALCLASLWNPNLHIMRGCWIRASAGSPDVDSCESGGGYEEEPASSRVSASIPRVTREPHHSFQLCDESLAGEIDIPGESTKDNSSLRAVAHVPKAKTQTRDEYC